MLIKYGLECSLDLEEKDSEATIKMNKGQGVLTKCMLQERERNLFEYIDVEVKVEMKGFHKKTIIKVI